MNKVNNLQAVEEYLKGIFLKDKFDYLIHIRDEIIEELEKKKKIVGLSATTFIDLPLSEIEKSKSELKSLYEELNVVNDEIEKVNEELNLIFFNEQKKETKYKGEKYV